MSGKRSRAIFEADLQKQQSPFVAFGTPLPPQDPDVRDDGSYVPVWKQEVKDERGSKRLHGAFTGGFSAGYYNTVGSKEGWTPSTFVSSRANRKKDEPKAAQQRPEDYMDEEDIADAEDAKRVQTAEGYAGLGSTQDDSSRRGALLDLFRVEGDTIGMKLLKKMGWKEGQGVGPKVRRKARLDGINLDHNPGATHLFAPENTQMIMFVKKNDHKGLGYDGEAALSSTTGRGLEAAKSDDDDEDDLGSLTSRIPKKKPPARGGIGIGVLNDTGSDDEDPYEVGPKISYNRVIGGDKKKKKKPANDSINPVLKSKPVFISKRAALVKASIGLRKCHDGRLPLDGFVLSRNDEFASVVQSSGNYNPPKVPEGWVSAKKPEGGFSSTMYSSTAEAAKASKLNPKSRAAILGESSLPGKSVFDFLSPAARERLVAASGKPDLPPALGEIPKGYNMTEAERERELLTQVPQIERSTAEAALSRGASGFMPYGDDESKRSRYRAYLENQAGISPSPPERGINVTRDDWLKELREFASCAQIFKPVSGTMSTRFTSATTAPRTDTQDSSKNPSLISKPAPKVEDPAEQAAKLGMFGPMTRSTEAWYPTRLLCKRFNVKPPAHVRPSTTEHGEENGANSQNKTGDLVSKSSLDEMMKDSWNLKQEPYRDSGAGGQDAPPAIEKPKEVVIDVERNEALEGQRAGEAVFKAIFGDSDDEN